MSGPFFVLGGLWLFLFSCNKIALFCKDKWGRDAAADTTTSLAPQGETEQLSSSATQDEAAAFSLGTSSSEEVGRG